jgi:hypothetical protein
MVADVTSRPPAVERTRPAFSNFGLHLVAFILSARQMLSSPFRRLRNHCKFLTSWPTSHHLLRPRPLFPMHSWSQPYCQWAVPLLVGVQLHFSGERQSSFLPAQYRPWPDQAWHWPSQSATRLAVPPWQSLLAVTNIYHPKTRDRNCALRSGA